MKTLGIIFLATLLSMSLLAQDNYGDAMKQALDNYGTAGSLVELQTVASQFERIAEVETEEWLPAYYASLIYSVLTFRTEELAKKEAYVEQAQNQLDHAIAIAPDESEVHALQGMVFQAHIVLDPEMNGQSYSAKANGSFQTAAKLNKENPRPLYLQAITIMYTPEEYGGGKKAALPLFEQAMILFNKFKPENTLYPNWGKEDCELNLKSCKEGA